MAKKRIFTIGEKTERLKMSGIIGAFLMFAIPEGKTDGRLDKTRQKYH